MSGETEAAAEPVEIEIEILDLGMVGDLRVRQTRHGTITTMRLDLGEVAEAEAAVELAMDHARKLSQDIGRPVRIVQHFHAQQDCVADR